VETYPNNNDMHANIRHLKHNLGQLGHKIVHLCNYSVSQKKSP